MFGVKKLMTSLKKHLKASQCFWILPSCCLQLTSSHGWIPLQSVVSSVVYSLFLFLGINLHPLFCRRTLFRGSSILSHPVGEGASAFGHKKSSNLTGENIVLLASSSNLPTHSLHATTFYSVVTTCAYNTVKTNNVDTQQICLVFSIFNKIFVYCGCI